MLRYTHRERWETIDAANVCFSISQVLIASEYSYGFTRVDNLIKLDLMMGFPLNHVECEKILNHLKKFRGQCRTIVSK